MVISARSIRVVGASAMAFVVAACNPPQSKQSGSSAASLDNLVSKVEGATEAEHKCGVEFTTLASLPEHVQIMDRNGRVKGPAAMKDIVLGTLAAAPVDLLRPFAFAGGVIEVMNTEDEAIKACADSPVTAAEKQLAGPDARVTSCWKVDASTRIILPPNSANIRKETLRQLSFFFTEYFVDRGLNAQAPFDGAEWQTWLGGVDKSRSALEIAFFLDVQRINPETHAKMTAAIAQNRRANYVYAEAIDSYYCSASTDPTSPRSIFRDRFSAAWKVFTDKNDEHSPVSLFGE